MPAATQEARELYEGGEYAARHSDWHLADAPDKARDLMPGLRAVVKDLGGGRLRIADVGAGVGGVLVFLPGLFVLYFFLTLLEDSGYLARADVGVYTAVSDPHMDVAVPTKVLEYAYMGLPVVASRLPVLERGFAPEALLLFEPGCAEEFARHILSLYEQPARRTALVQQMDRTFVEAQRRREGRRAYFALLDALLSGQPQKLPVAQEEAVDEGYRRPVDE